MCILALQLPVASLSHRKLCTICTLITFVYLYHGKHLQGFILGRLFGESSPPLYIFGYLRGIPAHFCKFLEIYGPSYVNLQKSSPPLSVFRIVFLSSLLKRMWVVNLHTEAYPPLPHPCFLNYRPAYCS